MGSNANHIDHFEKERQSGARVAVHCIVGSCGVPVFRGKWNETVLQRKEPA